MGWLGREETEDSDGFWFGFLQFMQSIQSPSRIAGQAIWTAVLWVIFAALGFTLAKLGLEGIESHIVLYGMAIALWSLGFAGFWYFYKRPQLANERILDRIIDESDRTDWFSSDTGPSENKVLVLRSGIAFHLFAFASGFTAYLSLEIGDANNFLENYERDVNFDWGLVFGIGEWGLRIQPIFCLSIGLLVVWSLVYSWRARIVPLFHYRKPKPSKILVSRNFEYLKVCARNGHPEPDRAALKTLVALAIRAESLRSRTRVFHQSADLPVERVCAEIVRNLQAYCDVASRGNKGVWLSARLTAIRAFDLLADESSDNVIYMWLVNEEDLKIIGCLLAIIDRRGYNSDYRKTLDKVYRWVTSEFFEHQGDSGALVELMDLEAIAKKLQKLAGFRPVKKSDLKVVLQANPLDDQRGPNALKDIA